MKGGAKHGINITALGSAQNTKGIDGVYYGLSRFSFQMGFGEIIYSNLSHVQQRAIGYNKKRKIHYLYTYKIFLIVIQMI